MNFRLRRKKVAVAETDEVGLSSDGFAVGLVAAFARGPRLTPLDGLKRHEVCADHSLVVYARPGARPAPCIACRRPVRSELDAPASASALEQTPAEGMETGS